MLRNKLFIIGSLLLFLYGCQSQGPEAIKFGEDQCVFCKMSISDPKYGSELITEKGRVYKFDAAECMVNYIKQEKPSYKQLYAIAYDEPKSLYPVDSLHFIISPDFRSPMGANLAAFQKSSVPEEYQFLSWEMIMKKDFSN